MRKNSFYPDGYVKLYDANTSKLLFEGHNMIVQGGRDFIRNCFLSRLVYKTLDGTRLPDNEDDPRSSPNVGISNTDYIMTILIGSGGSATKLSMDKLEEKQCSIIFENNESHEIKNDHMVISVDIDPPADKDFVARELGIGLSTVGSGDAQPLLFSRIVFDPIPFNASSKFKLDYYLYF